jgi:hypothetical protein
MKTNNFIEKKSPKAILRTDNRTFLRKRLNVYSYVVCNVRLLYEPILTRKY